MTTINVNFNNIISKIKPMHAVGQPPFWGVDYTTFQYLKDAKIPYSRLHDVGGSFGGFCYVDIPNIFRDFDADETLPESYDFAFTDSLITAMIEYDFKPIFRLGVTIENYHRINAYRIYPPADYAKWARICEHIIMHYNEGWAEGFHYDIEYWEIWNEPDNGTEPATNQMWKGTDEEYFELYTVASKHLKSCFGDSIKIGGYGSSGLYGILHDPEKYGMDIPKIAESPSMPLRLHWVDFFYDFLKYIKEHNAPLDFFSWHSYSNTERTVIMSEFLNKALKEFGYEGVETHLNEWNNALERRMRGTSYAAARFASMMLAMQNTTTDMLCFYDAQLGVSQYGGLFNPVDFKPFCGYYSFVAFGQLYELKNQTECVCDNSEIYALSASDGEKNAIMISNPTEEDKNLKISVDSNYIVYIIDEENHLTKTEFNPCRFTLSKNQVAFVANYEI